MSDPVPAVGKPRGAVMAWVGLALMVVAVVLVVLGAMRFLGGGGLVDALTSPVDDAPGRVTRTLEPGGYAVYEYSGPASTALAPTNSVPSAVTSVTVTGPSGEVPVRAPSGTQTITRGADEYQATAAFDVTAAGSYQIVIEASAPTRVVVAPAVFSAFARSAGAVVVIVVGALVGLVGLVLLVIGLVRRRRRPAPVGPGGPWSPGGFSAPAPLPADFGRAPAAPPLAAPPPPAPPVALDPPAGWYPEAGRLGGVRYWDGRDWTDHRA
jgi:hypothetical protein